MGRKNHLLLASLSAVIVLDAFATIWFFSQPWGRENLRYIWTPLILVIFPVLGIIADWSGVLANRPKDAVAGLVVVAVALLGIDLLWIYPHESNASAWVLLLAVLITLTLILAKTVLLKTMEDFWAYLGFGSGLFIIFCFEADWFSPYQDLGYVALLSSLMLFFAGGITAIHNGKGRGIAHAIGAMVPFVVCALSAIIIKVSTMGFS